MFFENKYYNYLNLTTHLTILLDAETETMKCCKKVMIGLVGERVSELIRQICKEHQVEILKVDVSMDHVHLFASVPPHLAISKLVEYLKVKVRIQENKQLSREFLGRHL